MSITTCLAPVLRTVDLTPRMRRVTVGGDALGEFASTQLPDQRIQLFIPPAGERLPVLPTIDQRGVTYPPGVLPPLLRTFTVRRFDQDARERDIDIALHADGPAAGWAANTRVGDRIGIAGPFGGYEFSPEAEWYLLAGDASALPAISTILERLPDRTRAYVFLEVADVAEEHYIADQERIAITWLHNHGCDPGSSRLLEQAIRTFPWPEGHGRIWAAGEALAMRGVRRYLRDERRLARHTFQVSGYWRASLSEEQAIQRYQTAVEEARAAGKSVDEIEDADIY